MKDNGEVELVNDVTPGQTDHLRASLLYWCNSQARFSAFVTSYADKIRSKFRGAKNKEDAADILAELETAFRLVSISDFQLSYEPFGNEGCDFKIDTLAGHFYVETKRIRVAAAMTQYSNCIDQLDLAIRAIKSQLTVNLSWKVLSAGPEFAQRIENHLHAIVDETVELVERCKEQIEPKGSIVYRLTCFPEAEFVISHNPEKTSASATSFRDTPPLLFSQRESFKFSDLLLGNLHQFKKDSSNVIVIRIYSLTHLPEELTMAAHAIQRHVDDCDEEFFQKKKFNSIQDFREKFRRLSAGVVIEGGIINNGKQNHCWVNETASKRLDQTLLDRLTSM